MRPLPLPVAGPRDHIPDAALTSSGEGTAQTADGSRSPFADSSSWLLQICPAPYGVVSAEHIGLNEFASRKPLRLRRFWCQRRQNCDLERPSQSRAGDPLDAAPTLTPVVAGFDDLVRLCRRARPPGARIRPRGRGHARTPGAATGAGSV